MIRGVRSFHFAIKAWLSGKVREAKFAGTAPSLCRWLGIVETVSVTHPARCPKKFDMRPCLWYKIKLEKSRCVA